MSGPDSPGPAGQFRALSREILAAAERGTSRAVFVREALAAFSRRAHARRVALRLEIDGAIRVYEADVGPPPRFETRRLPGLVARSPDAPDWRSRLDSGGAFTTRLGSLWVSGDAVPALASRSDLDRPAHLRAFDATAGAFASAWIPMVVAESPHAVLRIERADAPFDREGVRLYEAAAQILAVALEEQHARWALGERIKEIGCLYAIAVIAADRDASLETSLDRVAATLPPAWQHPSSASARITIDGHPHETAPFAEGPHRLTADIVAGGVRRGSVEVHYAADVPAGEGDGPFLSEEGRLLETVAREVGLLLDRQRIDDDRLRLEEQLRHADRLATLGQLAAGVAHEINEPLGSILGFAQLAGKNPGLPASAASDLDKIVRAALHARDIVRKLVVFARRDLPRKAPLSLPAVVREALTLVEARCAKAGIEIVREDDPRLLDVVADAAQIRQVVVNLAVNAVQAMPDGGRLTLRTRWQDDRAILEVEDSGVGMTSAVLERIFVPFFTTKDIGEGTGLGLPVAHGIVASHGGTIEADSRPGEGTRFVVALPLEAESAAR